MNETEQRGHAWLKRVHGYADGDIVFQARRSPDFLTHDGKGWEIKKARNSTVVFFPQQVVSLAAHPSISVVIFNGGEQPQDVYPYTDLTIPGYKDRYRFVIADRSDKNFSFFLVRFPIDLWQQLKDAAKVNDRTLTGEIVHRLRNSVSDSRPDR